MNDPQPNIDAKPTEAIGYYPVIYWPSAFGFRLGLATHHELTRALGRARDQPKDRRAACVRFASNTIILILVAAFGAFCGRFALNWLA